MTDRRPLSLDELKVRGAAALDEMRCLIVDFRSIAEDTRRTTRIRHRWTASARPKDGVAENAK